MKLLFKPLLLLISLLLRHPSKAVGVLVFGLSFVLIAGNALYSQSGPHPAPVWETRDTSAVTRSVEVASRPVSITRSVLTQKISIKNIPVPTASPVRRNNLAAQSSLVRNIQSALARVGLYQGKIDGIYGPGTREAIISYQEKAGILPDGEASYGLLTNVESASVVAGLQDKNTQAAVPVTPVSHRDMVVFDTATVSRIQLGLKENFGYEAITVDGVMGNQTRTAIREFQERFKLDATGEPNEETLRKLLSAGIISNI